MPNITLHIGYPKTATTYLQKKVLPRVGALGRHTSIPQARELDRPLGRIALLEKPSFWESTRGQNFFRELIRCSDQENVVISDEHFLWGPQAITPPLKKQKLTDKSLWPVIQHLEQIKHLADHLGYSLNALVTVRRQADFLGSFYAQCANRYTTPPTQEHFENTLTGVLEDDSLTGKRYLDYDSLHELLSTILGRESVAFLPLEAIASPEFSKELELFTGAKAKCEKNNEIHLNKKSCSDNTWNIRRPINLGSRNLAVRATDKPLKKLTGKTVSGAIRKIEKKASKTYEVFIPDWLRSEIDIQYKFNNSRLEQKTGWDLARLGYLTHDNQNTNSP